MPQPRHNAGIAAAMQLAQRQADQVRMAQSRANLLDVTERERRQIRQMVPAAGISKLVAASSPVVSPNTRSALAKLIGETSSPVVSPNTRSALAKLIGETSSPGLAPKSRLIKTLEAEADARKLSRSALEAFAPPPRLSPPQVARARPPELVPFDFEELERNRREADALEREETRAQHEALLQALFQIVRVQEAQLTEARRMQSQAEERARQAQADRMTERRRHEELEAKRDKRERILLGTAVASPVLSVIAIFVSLVAG